MLFFYCFSASVDAGQQSLEYKVKAAYLYNFTKFITWPEKQGDTFNICILGTDPFGSLLKPLEKKTALGKSIRLYRFQSIKQAKQCHILYFGHKESHRSPQLNGTLSDTLTISSRDGALTVSSQSFFARSGGMIGFVIRDGRIKLQVNLSVLKHNGFKISAKLLEVAELVEGNDDE